MSIFNPEVPLKQKEITHHPWERSIKNAYQSTYKYGHLTAKNAVYPLPTKKVIPVCTNPTKFTIIGNRTTKEFIYCINLVKCLHKHRCKHFDAPIIKGVTGVEWPKVWNDLKIKYGGASYCLLSQVAVLMNDKFLGGDQELKELVESKYMYNLNIDYDDEAVKQFSSYITSSGRPCAYFQISIDDVEAGTLIFMLYSDIVPRTCENFLRLCKTRKGGYSGTPIHRIVKDSWIQCGGYGLKDTELDCENFIVPHDRRGVLGMANDGRHIDCSTQFFVLLQPQEWMAFKYVAFGQLIDGEETLKKIEQVSTWYESPKRKIIIFRAGILNLECHDIVVNKGMNNYVQGHIENLRELGELFYEALLEKVLTEVEARSAERQLQGTEPTPEQAPNDLRATARFMRKKEEIAKQLEQSSNRSGKATSADRGENNNDFDVEEYEYQLEEYSYKHYTSTVESSSGAKREIPFYLPLTDVPYPGEVDSEYNLKKLLRGNYCLESDIDKKAMKKRRPEDTKSYTSEVFDALLKTVSHESDSSQQSLDSDDEKEIQKYLRFNSDRVSFAGGIIKTLAKKGKCNLLENQGTGSNELIHDEILRKFRMIEEERRANRDKKVSISVQARDHQKEIKRRPTGYVRPHDLDRILKIRKEEEPGEHDDESLEAYHPYTRTQSISSQQMVHKKRQQPPDRAHGEEKRKVTAFVDSNTILGSSDDQDDDSARIRVRGKIIRKPTGYVRGTQERPSILTRLLTATGVDEQGPGPILKDYVPYSESHEKERQLFLTFSPNKGLGRAESREVFLRRRSLSIDNMLKGPQKSIDQVLFMQHGKKVYRKISSDYVQTIDHFEQKEEPSLRRLEYAKKRPAMSIQDYQKKNQEYEQLMKKNEITSAANSKSKLSTSKF